MKASDICVGDWVYVVRGYDKHHTIEKIKGVIADEDEPYPVTISTGETVSLNDIKPIPLTSDILVKNGFKHSMPHNDWTNSDCNFYLYEGGNGYRISNTDIKLDYVHQLQHVLRLCGVEKELTI